MWSSLMHVYMKTSVMCSTTCGYANSRQCSLISDMRSCLCMHAYVCVCVSIQNISISKGISVCVNN